MPGAPSVESFHYNDGENRGEQPSTVIAQSVQANPKTPVWKQGMAGWTGQRSNRYQAHLNAPPPMPSLVDHLQRHKCWLHPCEIGKPTCRLSFLILS